MLDGVNDSDGHARELVSLVREHFLQAEFDSINVSRIGLRSSSPNA